VFYAGFPSRLNERSFTMQINRFVFPTIILNVRYRTNMRRLPLCKQRWGHVLNLAWIILLTLVPVFHDGRIVYGALVFLWGSFL